MKVLVLDDNPARLRVFADHFKEHDVTLVDNYADAINSLREGSPYDLVSLDHDLNDYGKKSTMPSMYGGGMEEFTGADVAWYIARELDEVKYPRRVVVHSWNPDGARRMVNLLQGLMPVTYELFQPPPGWVDHDDDQQTDLREKAD